MKKLLIGILLTLVLIISACSNEIVQQPAQVTVSVEQQSVESVEVSANSNPRTHTVEIKNFAFMPADLTISVGDTVVWVNKDNVVHTVTASNGEFDSSLLRTDKEFSHTFNKIGSYAYICTPHPSMKGSVKVR